MHFTEVDLMVFTKKIWFYACVVLLPVTVEAQQINIENITKQFGKGAPFKLSGGLSANSVAYTGTGGGDRSPFSYFLNGNVNLNMYGLINLPFSYSLTNAGKSYNYPTLPNRLSLHPGYKWINAHIGDVSMSFSPYTLNTYQFSGVGIDLTPQGPFKFSAMYGRLQRAVELDTLNQSVQTAYKRVGYGTKIAYEREKYRLGLVFFKAADQLNSLKLKPDSMQITPQENAAFSFDGNVKIAKWIQLSAEYATSMMTKDIRTGNGDSNKLLSKLFGENASSKYYHAIKSQVNFSVQKAVVGLGFERVDPGYQTLGAYYFNNDLQNITVNYSQPLFGNKASIALNGGFQHDDLEHTKAGKTSRTVGSANLTLTPNEKLNASISYSNFQSYMNMKQQFQSINQVNDLQRIDTLNFTQISQNAGANINYLFGNSKSKTQSLNLNISYQNAADKQGNIVNTGAASQFYNLSTTYNLTLVPRNLSFLGAINFSYNTIGKNDFLTVGPTVSVNGKFLNKKLNAGLTGSYNVSTASGVKQNTIANLRLNSSYLLMKKHNLNLNIVNQLRSSPQLKNTNDMTATMGYGYTF